MYRVLSIALMGLAVITSATTTTTTTTADDERILFVGDCNGGFHFMPDSPYEFNLNLKYFKTMTEAFHEGVVQRAKGACPTMSTDDIRTLFLPTLESTLNFVGPYDKRVTVPAECADKFTRKFFSDSTRDTMFSLYNSYNFLGLFTPNIASLFSSTAQAGYQWVFGSGSGVLGIEWQLYLPWMLAYNRFLEPAAGSFIGHPFPLSSSNWTPNGRTKIDLPDTCTLESVAAGRGCAFSGTEPTSQTSLHVAIDNCPASNLTYTSVSCSGGFCADVGKLCRSDGDCPGSNLACRRLLNNDDVASIIRDFNVFPSDDTESMKKCGGHDNVASQVVAALEKALLGTTLTGDVNGIQLCAPTPDAWTSFKDSLNDWPNSESTDMHSLDAARVDACQTNHNCSVVQVGNGVCEMDCNNPDCMHDGGDCRNLPTLNCPVNPRFPSLECSGRGQCAGTTCYCNPSYCPSDAGASGASCENCWDPSTSTGAGPYTDDYGYYGALDGDDDQEWVEPGYCEYADCTMYQRTLMAHGVMKPQSWDGSALLTDDHKSGFAYSTPPTTMAPAQSDDASAPMFYFSPDGSFGFTVMHPDLGFAVSAPHLIGDVATQFLSVVLPHMATCRAEAEHASPLSATDLQALFGVTTPLSWMLQFSKIPDGFSFSTLGCGWLMDCPSTWQWKNGLRLEFPSSCSISNSKFDCKAEYTNLASLLGLSSVPVYFHMQSSTSYPTPALPSIGLTVGNNVASFLSSPTPCSSDAQCSSGVCVDLSDSSVFNLPTTSDWDPMSVALFGKFRNSNPSAANPTAFKRTIRHLLLKLGNLPQDGDSDLRFCFLDTHQLSKNAADWAHEAVDTSCTQDRSCFTHPATVKGLGESTVAVAPAVSPSSNIVADAVPPLPAGLYRATTTLTLPGTSLKEGQKLLLKSSVASALPGLGVTQARLYVSAVSVSEEALTASTGLKLAMDVPSAKALAVTTAIKSSSFLPAVGSALASSGGSSAAAPTPNPDGPSKHGGGGGGNGGKIAGGVVGALAGVAVVVGAAFWVSKRRKSSDGGKDSARATTNGGEYGTLDDKVEC